MKSKRYSSVVFSIFLVLFQLICSVSVAKGNETEVLSIDESVNIVNEKLALDSSLDNAVSNDNNVIEKNNGNNLLSVINCENDGIVLKDNCRNIMYIDYNSVYGEDGKTKNENKIDSYNFLLINQTNFTPILGNSSVIQTNFSNLPDNSNVVRGTNFSFANLVFNIDVILVSALDLNNVTCSVGIPILDSIDNTSYLTYQTLYLFSKPSINVYLNIASNFKSWSVKKIVQSSIRTNLDSVDENQYVELANSICENMEIYGEGSCCVEIAFDVVNFTILAGIFTKVLSFYKIMVFSDYMLVNESGVVDNVSVCNILDGALYLNTFFNSHCSVYYFLLSIKVVGFMFTLPKFLYLMSSAVYRINNLNFNNVSYTLGIDTPNMHYGDDINFRLDLNQYVVERNVYDGVAHKYVSYVVGKIHYVDFVDSFSYILVFYCEYLSFTKLLVQFIIRIM